MQYQSSRLKDQIRHTSMPGDIDWRSGAKAEAEDGLLDLAFRNSQAGVSGDEYINADSKASCLIIFPHAIQHSRFLSRTGNVMAHSQPRPCVADLPSKNQ